MKITFLGTGSGVPSKHRNVSSLSLHPLDKKGSTWLFDCGEGTQQQILHTAIKLRKIEKIFITHLHGDHIFGLPGLLGSRSFQGGETPLTIYGPNGIKEYIEVALLVSGTYLNYPLQIQEFQGDGLLFNEGDYSVSVGALVHGLPSFGFRIEERDQPGPLLMSKVKDADIPSGPILQQLKEGLQVTLEDGRVFSGKNFIGPPKKGKVIAILGDTRSTHNAGHLVAGANVMVHEATFRNGDEVLAHDYFHSTTVQVAELAKKAEVNKLILNHISSRYQKEAVEEMLVEAKAIFPNTYIAEDFSSFEIT